MKQFQLGILSEIDSKRRPVPEREIALCSNHSEILHLCIKYARSSITGATVAKRLGIDKGQFNRVLNGSYSSSPRWLSLDKLSDIEIICQNSAISQWFALRAEGRLLSSQEARFNHG